MLYVGDRVRVVAAWSSFVGMSGVVTATRPHLMVRLDGDRHPIRVSDSEVMPDFREISMTGAE